MQIIVEISDGLFEQHNPGRLALKAIAIAGFDGFLKHGNIFDYAYGPEDLIEDRKTLSTLRLKMRPI